MSTKLQIFEIQPKRSFSPWSTTSRSMVLDAAVLLEKKNMKKRKVSFLNALLLEFKLVYARLGFSLDQLKGSVKIKVRLCHLENLQ